MKNAKVFVAAVALITLASQLGSAGAAPLKNIVLVHGAWDAYHFAVNRVVSRPWSEFCGVVDLLVGAALLVVGAG